MFEHVGEGCQCEGKVCSRCKQLKCYGMFGRRSDRKSGLVSHCRVCQRQKNVDWYNRNRDKSLAKSKQWRQENLEYAKSYDKLYRETHKVRYDAYRQSHRNYYRAYYHANKIKDQERRRHYFLSNKERITKADREHYALHKEEILVKRRSQYYRRREWYRGYRQQHLLQRRIYGANRRARKKQAGGTFTVQEWIELVKKYEGKCLCCGRSEPEISLTADHIIPISKGGRSDIDNIQPLCLSCNNHKMTRAIDYRKDVLNERASFQSERTFNADQE